MKAVDLLQVNESYLASIPAKISRRDEGRHTEERRRGSPNSHEYARPGVPKFIGCVYFYDTCWKKRHKAMVSQPQVHWTIFDEAVQLCHVVCPLYYSNNFCVFNIRGTWWTSNIAKFNLR